MLSTNPHATVFQTREWYTAWIDSVAITEAAEPIILRVPAEGASRAAVALQISKAAGYQPAIRPLSSPWADYHEAVGRIGDREIAEALAWALKDFAEAEGCSLDFNDVVPDGFLAKILSIFPGTHQDSTITEAIDLTDERHVNQVLARKEHAIKWRRLQRLGVVHCHHYRNTEEILERLPVFIEMHKRQWEGRTDAMAPFDGGVVDAAFQLFVRHLAPSGLVILTEFMLDSRVIAMYFGFVFGARYLGYRTSFDLQYRRFSPGHAMLRQMIHDFRASGLREIDLMRGAYGYKREYTNRISRNLHFQHFRPTVA